MGGVIPTCIGFTSMGKITALRRRVVASPSPMTPNAFIDRQGAPAIHSEHHLPGVIKLTVELARAQLSSTKPAAPGVTSLPTD